MTADFIKKNFRLILITAALLLSMAVSPVLAEEISMTATVDKNEISLEDTLRLSISIHGVQNSGEPQLPLLPEFRVRPAGTSSSTRIINGQISASITYSYQLTPLETGTFTIEPARLNLNGTIYKTDPVTISVSKSSGKTARTDVPAFVETQISNTRPFVNEQIIYTFKLYRRVEAKNLNLAMSYEDTDFRKVDMGDAKTYPQVRNGIQYQVHELSSALYPIHAGMVEIPPAILELDLVNRNRSIPGRDPFSRFFDDPFFGSGASFVHKVLRSEPIRIEVQPLPQAGKPDKFSNLVGQFQVSSSLGKEELTVGDSTTLTVTVKGPGNIGQLSLDPPDAADVFKIYPDQPESTLKPEGNTLTGEKAFKFALVPLKFGKRTLPSLAVNYFDPVQKKYVTARTKSYPLTIIAAGDKEELKVTESMAPEDMQADNSIKVLGEDILPIHTRLTDFKQEAIDRSDVITSAAALIVPPILFFLFAGYERHRFRLRHDVAFSRNRNAFKVAANKLKFLDASPHSNSRELVKNLSEIFREYIGNKLNFQGKAFTSLEVERKLKDRMYPEDQVAATRRLLEKYESFQYASIELNKNEDLIDESLDLLRKLEKHV